MAKLTNFDLPVDAYAAFDATSLKSLIIDRLNNNSFFTDQNFEGSNMSSIIDIIAYSYHVLLFYLNQTSSESLFTDAQLYENMNRIVKSLDYKPVGSQTSTLSFKAEGSSSLAADTYTIPRFSFINIGGMSYSFKEDITFTKLTPGTETLSDVGTNNLLYQGRFEEYPSTVAVGEKFEIISLLPGDDIIIDHFNIYVYVKDVTTNKWSEWTRTSSLFLDGPTHKNYEVRLNENKRYEVKFGDDITGKKLNSGDVVAVYYLKSDGKKGETGINSLNGNTLGFLNTVRFVDIFNSTKDSNINYLSQEQASLVSFSNTNASTEYFEGETVEDIRTRAPNIFSSQYRLVTKPDYENYIKQSFSNIIRDVKVVNNWDYVDGHLDYIINTLNLSSSSKESNTLYNQVNFADSCDFNNVYIYAVPKLEKSASTIVRTNYLTPAQKSSIIDSVRENKTLTTETIIVDPVYMSIDLGVRDTTETLTSSITDKCKLQLIREASSRKSLDSIKNTAYSLIVDYFKVSSLGTTINVTNLVNDLLNIDGVKTVKTTRTDITLEGEGLSLLVWNPVYPEQDIAVISSNLTLPFFKYPYLNNSADFLDKIEAISESTSTGSAEF